MILNRMGGMIKRRGERGQNDEVIKKWEGGRRFVSSKNNNGEREKILELWSYSTAK